MEHTKPLDESIFKNVLSSLKRQVMRIVIEDLALSLVSYVTIIMFMVETKSFFPFVPAPGYIDKPIFETNLYLRTTTLVYLSFIIFLTLTGIIVLLGTILEKRALLFIWYISHSLLVFLAAGYLIFIVLYLPLTESINYIIIFIGPISYRAGRIGYTRSYQIALDYYKEKTDFSIAYFQGSDPVTNLNENTVKAKESQNSDPAQSEHISKLKIFLRKLLFCKFRKDKEDSISYETDNYNLKSSYSGEDFNYQKK